VVLGVVLVLSINYWYISVPVLVLTAIAVGVTVHRQHVRQRQAATTAPPPAPVAPFSPPQAVVASPPQAQVLQRQHPPPLTVPADTFKVGSLVHLEKDGTRATYFVDHGRTPDEIVLKRVTSPRTPNSAPDA